MLFCLQTIIGNLLINGFFHTDNPQTQKRKQNKASHAGRDSHAPRNFRDPPTLHMKLSLLIMKTTAQPVKIILGKTTGVVFERHGHVGGREGLNENTTEKCRTVFW